MNSSNRSSFSHLLGHGTSRSHASGRPSTGPRDNRHRHIGRCPGHASWLPRTVNGFIDFLHKLWCNSHLLPELFSFGQMNSQLQPMLLVILVFALVAVSGAVVLCSLTMLFALSPLAPVKVATICIAHHLGCPARTCSLQSGKSDNRSKTCEVTPSPSGFPGSADLGVKTSTSMSCPTSRRELRTGPKRHLPKPSALSRTWPW